MLTAWKSVAWTSVVIAATAVPLLYLFRRFSKEETETRESLALLRKVELIVAEVATRLLLAEKQAYEALTMDAVDDDAQEDNSVSDSSLNSYYHFDSQGNKLKTKWDSYDVDAELEKLDQEDDEDDAEKDQAKPKNKNKKPLKSLVRRKQEKKPTKSQVLQTAGGIEHELEAVLSFLDDIRGNESVKAKRKEIVESVHQNYFPRIDSLRRSLA